MQRVGRETKEEAEEGFKKEGSGGALMALKARIEDGHRRFPPRHEREREGAVKTVLTTYDRWVPPVIGRKITVRCGERLTGRVGASVRAERAGWLTGGDAL